MDRLRFRARRAIVDRVPKKVQSTLKSRRAGVTPAPAGKKRVKSRKARRTAAMLSRIAAAHSGGRHKRERADSMAMRDIVIELGGIDDKRLRKDIRHGYATDMRSVFATVGYSEQLRHRIAGYRDELFALEPKAAKIRQVQVKNLSHRVAAKRLVASKWFLSQATKSDNKLIDALLCSPDVTEALVSALGAERDPRVRRCLGRALGFVFSCYFPDARALPVLLSMLDEGDAALRRAAIIGLGATSCDQWPAVVALLQDRDGGVRGAACREIKLAFLRGEAKQSELKRAGALQALGELLEDKVADNRLKAANTLLTINPKRHQLWVEEALAKERAPTVRRRLQQLLGD